MPLSAFKAATRSLSEFGLNPEKIGETEKELPPTLVRAITQNGGDPSFAVGFKIAIKPMTLNGKQLAKPAVQMQAAKVLTQTPRDEHVLLAYVLHKGDLLAAFALKK